MASPTKHPLTPAQKAKVAARIREDAPTAAPSFDQAENTPQSDFPELPIPVPIIATNINMDYSRLIVPGDYLG